MPYWNAAEPVGIPLIRLLAEIPRGMTTTRAGTGISLTNFITMGIRMAATGGAVLIGALLAAHPAGGVMASSRDAITASGLSLIDSLPFEGGTEIAADRDFVYANQIDGTTARGQFPERGGVRVLSSNRGRLIEHGFLHCAGNDNDVQPLRGDLIVVAHHTSSCNLRHGLLIVDVGRLRAPRVIARLALPDNQAHTVTPHPRAPVVYVSPGGLFNGNGEQVIVDVSKPRAPSIAGTFTPSPAGCHDLSTLVRDEVVTGFCAGFGETSIWDLTDPVDPIRIGAIHNPAIEFMYVALPSPDGRILAIADEAFAGHECSLGQGPGSVWLYDISDLSVPTLLGRITPPARGAKPIATTDDITSWCAAHGLAWHPKIDGLLAATWYTAGIGVYDVSGTVPAEVAFFRADDSLSEAVVWHKGLLYANDLRRGVDVFTFDP